MSRWLKSVNSLLEQLDDKVETAVEEHEASTFVDDDDQNVNDILAKRGYDLNKSTEKEQEIVQGEKKVAAVASVNEAADSAESDGADAGVIMEETVVAAEETVEQKEEATVLQPQELPKQETGDVTPNKDGEEKQHQSEETLLPPPHTTPAEAEAEGDLMEAVSLEDEATPSDRGGEEVPKDPDLKTEDSKLETETTDKEPTEAMSSISETAITTAAAPASTDKVASTPPSTSHTSQKQPQVLDADYKKALTDAREAQKECRTLRRHVVSLNSELESAEAEIQAQRTELERAAERMEKDRARQKEEKDRLVARHAEEVKALKLQQVQTVADLKARAEQQAEEARKRMKELEERRMQEGGDWTKEMENALHREQESVRRMANLEDEKSTLLSQISTLQAQQTALENRLNSVSQTADNAMEREREAEDRLDAALSMHARQLTQRQARESELERTIADLGAALVVARNKEINRLKADPNTSAAGERGGNDVAALRTRLEDSEDQKETLLVQLELERQRCTTMQQDLHELSKERTEEAAAAHARQLQSDRKIADMSVTISRLQANAREAKKAAFSESRDSIYSSDDGERSSQVKSLSDQVLKQQETIARSRSEIAALKNRLQVAVGRAEKAEETLATFHDSDDVYDRMERAPLSGSSDVGMRRIRRRGHGGETESIRSAIRLNPHNGEKIGKAIDAVDSFSVQTGKYLRANPIARAGFLLYLIMVHIWTFLLLIFHAHSFETVHGDFGAGHEVPHGPHALMQAHDPSGVAP